MGNLGSVGVYVGDFGIYRVYRGLVLRFAKERPTWGF